MLSNRREKIFKILEKSAYIVINIGELINCIAIFTSIMDHEYLHLMYFGSMFFADLFVLVFLEFIVTQGNDEIK